MPLKTGLQENKLSPTMPTASSKWHSVLHSLGFLQTSPTSTTTNDLAPSIRVYNNRCSSPRDLGELKSDIESQNSQLDYEAFIAIDNSNEQLLDLALKKGAKWGHTVNTKMITTSPIKYAIKIGDRKIIETLKPYVIRDVDRFIEALKARLTSLNDTRVIHAELSRINTLGVTLVHFLELLSNPTDKNKISSQEKELHALGVTLADKLKELRSLKKDSYDVSQSAPVKLYQLPRIRTWPENNELDSTLFHEHTEHSFLIQPSPRLSTLEHQSISGFGLRHRTAHTPHHYAKGYMA